MKRYWRQRDSDTVRNPTEEQLADYDVAADEDVELFNRLTALLPLDRMYGLGPHSIPILRDVLELTKPDCILEFGFGAGASAALWLGLAPQVRLTSVDWTKDPEVLEAARLFAQWHAPRFTLFNGDSRQCFDYLVGQPFDLCFIDGGHGMDVVRSDIRTARWLDVRWILFDDWWPKYGPGVQPAVDTAVQDGQLEVVEQWGNMVLARRIVPDYIGGNLQGAWP